VGLSDPRASPPDVTQGMALSRTLKCRKLRKFKIASGDVVVLYKPRM
jgi:hypothetical protein